MVSRAHTIRGFTLIELMVTVAVIGIVAGLAIGFGGDWRRRAEGREVIREIYNGVTRTRAEAIRQGRMVMVEFTTDRMTAFNDKNGNDAFDDGTDLIHYQWPIDGGGTLAAQVGDRRTGSWPTNMSVAISANILAANSGATVLVFDAQGFLVDTTGSPIAGTVTLTDSDEGIVRYLDVTIAGALRVR